MGLSDKECPLTVRKEAAHSYGVRRNTGLAANANLLSVSKRAPEPEGGSWGIKRGVSWSERPHLGLLFLASCPLFL